MNFQQPHYLWFLFLLLIPLLIHLVNFQRTRVLYFPGVYRLIERMQQARQQKKVQNWLIWLFRTLALLSVIVAFALPTCHSSGSGLTGADRYILVLDNSLSAKVESKDGVAFEKMRTEIRRFLEGMDQGKLVYLIVQSSNEGSGWLPAEEVVKIVDTLDCYSQYNGWSAWKDQVDQAVKLGVATAGLQPERTRVMVFTDFDVATAGAATAQGNASELQRDSQNQRNKTIKEASLDWQVIRFPISDKGNICIDSAWLSSDKDSSVLPGISVKVRNFSQDRKNIPVTLTSMGKVLGSKQIELQSSGSTVVTFPSNFSSTEPILPVGANARMYGQGFVVSISGDSYPWDDKLYLHSSPQWNLRVGVLGELGALSRVFEVQPRIRYQVLRRPLLAENTRLLNSICLLGNEALSTEEQSVLQDFMDNGGVVFQAFQRAALGAVFEIQSPFGILKSKFQNQEFLIDKSGFSHPVFADAFSQLPDESTSIPKIKSRWELIDNADYSALLQGENNEVILMERSWGRGSYWLWTSDLTMGSSDWMRSSWVLPTFTELLSANNKRNFPLFGTVKTESVVAVPGLNSMTEGGISMWYLGENIPQRVDLSSRVSWIKEWQQQIQGTGGLYLGEQPEKVGYYAVKANDDYRLIALNTSRNESALIAMEDANAYLSNLGITEVDFMDGAVGRQASDLSDSNRSWRLLLIASLFFLMVESYLLWRKNMQNRQG